ncbi:RNA polymerase sigma factor [Prevotella lacticifex]|jgi:RNA polymerase sigma-70 factor (ECF subfamily)|uniref:DNA-directed RNA polymerase sigma-70 factor n=1 Tax=Prevotella lacticifex TaxID=2854755 RepID=A0A9R1CC84_9BACT|nr:RNA polymerase sigma factor [Prevotella lacticifex]GJG36480.1 DNA-directed RNA polymerase sigma-70 factor [Prevotella lacticifex]GJG38339.1 DNA-directed RNA polymerase sigma-70 factor [Prevotella lacticifex]GJG42978.1 DNA-directed RNA polymerase sigma-70 factor [Prevotella lacticifex]GJG44696.1 DNA-directed RNA polymerase sigma-70 factor [Prevotella lacticifex]GJG49329.1 DNA-directed RNA polymerase sigma-70 factor [Prevotella lacticifex]
MKNVSFRNDVLPLKNELFRLALRITLDRADAEDVVQETMIKVWSKRDSWDDIDNVEAFSMTICRNLALDHAKRRENDNERLDADNVREPVAPSNPFEQAVNQDRVQIVRRIVDSLPEKQRSCIQLRDFEGKQYKEIASILTITEEQVKVNIFRARQTIKQKFLEAEAFHAKHRESK